MAQTEISERLKKETLAQVFSCEFCDILRRTPFYRTTVVVVSEKKIIDRITDISTSSVDL